MSCYKKLTKHDHIHIFSTTNAPKISIETLASFNFAEQFSHIIPSGKQSLDMHLVSYLGYLIGINCGNRCRYIIISKDTDYDNIILFFRRITSQNITRQSAMDTVPKQVPHNKITSKQVSINTSDSNKPATTNIKNNKASAVSKNKTLLNASIQEAVSKAGYDSSTINKTASIATKHYGSSNILCNVHNELRSAYPNCYSDIYKIIKPIISRASSTAAANQNTIVKPDGLATKLFKSIIFYPFPCLQPFNLYLVALPD